MRYVHTTGQDLEAQSVVVVVEYTVPGHVVGQHNPSVELSHN